MVKTHSNPFSFISFMLAPARACQSIYGIPVSVLIAQSALETGWGRHVKGNAYFGIKGKSPTGSSIVFGTHEEVAGKSIARSDTFRSYSGAMAAAIDYGRFITSNPRYAPALRFVSDPYRYVDEMARAGYATDHNYAFTIKSIIRHHNLLRFDGVKIDSPKSSPQTFFV